ncbi:aminotransferase class I/II-fold pyridoxal phosphate-dependent enzyme [Actinoplanes sp. LDG1-06]|uniref:Aminotransferase class I/II-fold pyridoxal phosphate-dependent enzyme n=1 Tax=Paractinoplanes ovalisporus TaxID=2810368 RepID=A0ABS2A656_9ACTN|nr:GntG family PLP-dependent aldolase [Actinoplanes ovalisporus]MBM2615200.1 aminotransferase class I/II-fold pyridoxal phosphate-dependent enzyme [Actinoplanes ovalisporus]
MVDLRSDTVTRPTAEMRQAMASAEVGDDVFGDDPTVNDLEAYVAGLFGHEAALFAPSGSMANQIALQLHVQPGSELLAGGDAHVVTYELGAAAAIGGITTRTWPSVGADLDVEQIAAMIRPVGYPSVPTKAIAVEQTHNLGGGTVVPLETLRGLREMAERSGVGLHCDGARIWHAHVADGVPLATYGALFDTLSVCLSKGLGAPVGSLIIGSRERIAQARVLRKRMGGGMRQVGILAAAGRHALENHIDRLADDHARARKLAEALAPLGVVDPSRIRTNLVPLDLSKSSLDAPTLAALAAKQGVLIAPMLPDIARVVTHLDVDDEGIDQAIVVLGGLISGS